MELYSVIPIRRQEEIEGNRSRLRVIEDDEDEESSHQMSNKVHITRRMSGSSSSGKPFTRFEIIEEEGSEDEETINQNDRIVLIAGSLRKRIVCTYICDRHNGTHLYCLHNERKCSHRYSFEYIPAI
ncbi:hypothetical protein GQ600_26966 [Phytophthora cactorum]|nr:hypothetical protein GQ600_26966 [Phytophthora cactorum]